MLINFLILITLAVTLAHAGHAPAQQEAASEPGRSSKKSDRRARQQEPRAEAGATSSSRLALPFKRSWQYLTESAATLPPALDDARVYLPLAGGRVVCLNRQDGALLWSSEPGGIITTPVAAGEKALYVATRKIAEDGLEAGGSLRAIDKTTGLTLWASDYARPFTSPLVLGAGRIYAGSADGSFYSMSAADGKIIWKVGTQDVVGGRALVTERAVYFGSDDGALRAVEPESGREVWRFQTAGKIVGRPAVDEQAVYFGSADGHLYSVDVATGKLRWRARAGAAIEASPQLIGDRVLVASFDNFVYALSRSNGNRIWKRRLDNRIAADPIVEGDATMIAPLRGDHVAVFLNSDGRRVNFYRLDGELEIVAEPVFSGDTLLLSTDKGLIVVSTAPAADGRTNAIKK
jgi:outer membrane protein assembly factor BamB